MNSIIDQSKTYDHLNYKQKCLYATHKFTVMGTLSVKFDNL